MIYEESELRNICAQCIIFRLKAIFNMKVMTMCSVIRLASGSTPNSQHYPYGALTQSSHVSITLPFIPCGLLVKTHQRQVVKSIY